MSVKNQWFFFKQKTKIFFLLQSAFAFLTMVFVCLFWYLDIRDIRALEQEESKSLLHDGKVLKL